MKKIIVTAPTSAVAKGFIKFSEQDYEIITVGRRESDITFDFLEDTVPQLPSGADSIVHFAGVTIAGSDKDLLQMTHTNVLGVLKLCSAAKMCGVKQIIYISSIFATLEPDSPYYNFYSLTKKQGEELARLYCSKNNIPLCIIRPSQIFGTDTALGKMQRLIYTMFKNAAEGKPITIYGEKDALRNYIYADNVYSLICSAIELCAVETIDAIDQKNYRLSELAKLIISAFESKSSIEFLPERPDVEDNGFFARTDYFNKWNIPFISFEEAVQRIAQA